MTEQRTIHVRMYASDEERFLRVLASLQEAYPSAGRADAVRRLLETYEAKQGGESNV